VLLFREAEGALGRAFGFTSITEVSEYVPAERRTPDLVEQRLHPRIPDHPFVSFYPMSKRREKDRNWFRLPFEERARLMHGHGVVGRKYAGEIQQIITTAFGLDDWEWGVTLFGRTEQVLRDCVHEMRFDEASAEYAEFGPFYFGPRLDRARIEALLCP
jgi:chlorite dismutase